MCVCVLFCGSLFCSEVDSHRDAEVVVSIVCGVGLSVVLSDLGEETDAVGSSCVSSCVLLVVGCAWRHVACWLVAVCA